LDTETCKHILAELALNTGLGQNLSAFLLGMWRKSWKILHPPKVTHYTTTESLKQQRISESDSTFAVSMKRKDDGKKWEEVLFQRQSFSSDWSEYHLGPLSTCCYFCQIMLTTVTLNLWSAFSHLSSFPSSLRPV